jgi:hypothetical protein
VKPNPLADRSKADRLLGLRVRIPPNAWQFVSCEWVCVCCQANISTSGWSTVQMSFTDCGCVTVCDLETSAMKWPWPALGCWTKEEEEEEDGKEEIFSGRVEIIKFLIMQFPPSTPYFNPFIYNACISDLFSNILNILMQLYIKPVPCNLC